MILLTAKQFNFAGIFFRESAMSEIFKNIFVYLIIGIIDFRVGFIFTIGPREVKYLYSISRVNCQKAITQVEGGLVAKKA